MIEPLPIDPDGDPTPREPLQPPVEVVEAPSPRPRHAGVVVIPVERSTLADLARRRGLGPFLAAAAARRNR